MNRLEDRRIWVSAAGSGIGRACAEACWDEGARVFATDRAPDGLALLAEHCRERMETRVLDGRDGAGVNDFCRRTGAFDGMVHCIGIVPDGTVLQCTIPEWQEAFRVNVDTFCISLQAALPDMVQAGRGSIVTIASVASSLKGLPNRAAYGATKAALIGLTKSVAADFVAAGIRCNAVCPGTVRTPSLLERVQRAGAAEGSLEVAMEKFVSRQPMGRLGTPDEVASLCVYLLSDESRFMTGQALAIDGGMTI